MTSNPEWDKSSLYEEYLEKMFAQCEDRYTSLGRLTLIRRLLLSKALGEEAIIIDAFFPLPGQQNRDLINHFNSRFK